MAARARTASVLLLFGLTVLLLGCADQRSAPGPGTITTSSAPRDAAAVQQLLGEVRRVTSRPKVPGYERGCSPGEACVFGTDWSDDTDAALGHNGCDTRNDVLALTLTDVEFSDRSPSCDVVGGLLRDPYTGGTLDYATDSSQIHIDHLFPLAAAWDLGAAGWTSDERAAFANDPGLELLAVSGSANLSKGDSTPASWLPPNKPYRCAYVTAYLEVALAYDLAVTDADVRVIEPAVGRWC